MIAPDLRGHGRSTWDPPWYVDAHVADLADVLDGVGAAARVAVAGHSFGGLLGMALAAARPERVERLALLDPAVAVEPAVARPRAEGARRDEGWASREEARAARLALRPAARARHGRRGPRHLPRRGPGRPRAASASRRAGGRHGVERDGRARRPRWRATPGRVLLVPRAGPTPVPTPCAPRLRRDLGDRLRERGIDAGHMLFWDAPGSSAGSCEASSA